MSNLQLTIISSEGTFSNGILTLPNEGDFKVSIKEYQDEFKILRKKYFEDTFAPQKLEEKKKLLLDKYKNVNWVWALVPSMQNNEPTLLNHNKNFNKGLNEEGEKIFNFPELLVGGGIIYLEAFLEGQQPTGNTGIFVKATGKPAFVRTEWTDFSNNPLNETAIRYGSEVLLHVYTKDLYNLDIEIQLFDKEKVFANRQLNISDQWAFQRKVRKEELLPFEKGEKGVGGSLTDTNSKNSTSYVQKVIIKVKIESVWEYIVKGLFGNIDIEIFAKVFHKKEELPILIESPLLIVKEDGKLYDEPEEVTNQPVLVEDMEMNNSFLMGKPISFTFGVFIDGTLNNMYNTEMKQKIDNKKQNNKTGLDDNIKIGDLKKKYKKHGDPDYSESSYENDLSNPAILFKNYEVDNQNVFKVYTEGIGTHSAPKEQEGKLELDDYKGDDMMQGPAFGEGDAGIVSKVRKSISDIVKKIKENLTEDGNQYIDTITFDVFGFSRGAAAARHFVHVVKHSAYKPKQSLFQGDNDFVRDLQGYDVNSVKYYNQLMPPSGLLGQLLHEADLLDPRTKVNVRFVGIYDTVPHHGFKQSNDAKDLGLHDVNKAEYVVHMIAADEYRYNFDLVKISSVNKTTPESGKKGGIELTYPGVHCDVGGAYVEGSGNRCYRLALSYEEDGLEWEKKEFEKQGWYKKEELSTHIYLGGYRLEGFKKKVSNQYSYIPLHIMAQFCELKKLPIKEVKIINIYNYQFTPNFIDNLSNSKIKNVDFLNNIKKKLVNYSLNNGTPITYTEAEKYSEPKATHLLTPEESKVIRERYKTEQDKLDMEADRINYDIKLLRYHYLHWNSTYGDPKEAIGTWLSGKNKPNIKDGKRKRDVH